MNSRTGESRLNCLQCKARFDSDDHKPLLLPCEHVLCKECLSTQEDDNCQRCIRCYCDWSDQNIFELSVVHQLITKNVNGLRTGKEVVRAPSEAVTANGTGKEVVPVEDESLMCPLCASDYDKSQHRPKLLGCNHTFCLRCLSTQTRSSCPSCSKPWSGMARELPNVDDLISPNAIKKLSYKLTSNNINGEELDNRSTQLAESRKMQLFITGVNGKTQTIKVPRFGGTVDHIYEELGPSHGETSTTFGGRTLQKGRTLEHYSITDGSTLNQTCRMRGGY